MITTQGALALILGGCVGISSLVVIVSFDIKVVSLYVLGCSGAVLVSERLSRFRPVAASFLGGAMIILGLALLKDAAAPLAEQPGSGTCWKGPGIRWLLPFLVAVFLTFIVQSSSAVSVFGISLATVGVISVDQAIMVMYGTCIGSAQSSICCRPVLRASRVRSPCIWWGTTCLSARCSSAALLRDPLRHPVGEGVGSRLRSGTWTSSWPLSMFFMGLFLLPVMLPGLKWSASISRTAVADLTRRRTVTAAVHSRPCLRGRRHVPRACRPGAEACNEKPVPVLRSGAPGRKDRASARFHAGNYSPTSRSSWDDLQTLRPLQGVEDRKLLEESSEAPCMDGGSAGSSVQDPGG